MEAEAVLPTADRREVCSSESVLSASTPMTANGIESDLAFVEIYQTHLPIMVGIAVRDFRIPEMDAETLAHEIFVDLLVRWSTVIDRSGWLVGAIYNASRHYLRKQARSEPLPEDIGEMPDPNLRRVLDMWPDQLAAREAFACTTARCQLALHLRYLEGYTVPEIAAELGTTPRYAARLIENCLDQASRRYEKKKNMTKAGAPS